MYGFGYFAFFGYFLVAKLKVSIRDESYLENTMQAKAFVGSLATLELSILFVLSALLPRVQHMLIFGITICFVSELAIDISRAVNAAIEEIFVFD